MVGDAFGFVDPMLSPGVFLALRSAELVADALGPFAKSARAPAAADIEAALRPYAAMQTAMLAAWIDLIATFYDGRMAALFRAGRDWMSSGTNTFKSAAQNHIERHIALQASGAGTLGRYSRGLLRFMGRYGRRGVEPTELAIRSDALPTTPRQPRGEPSRSARDWPRPEAQRRGERRRSPIPPPGSREVSFTRSSPRLSAAACGSATGESDAAPRYPTGQPRGGPPRARARDWPRRPAAQRRARRRRSPHTHRAAAR